MKNGSTAFRLVRSAALPLFCLYSLLGLYGTEWIVAARRDPEAYPMEATGKYISSVHLIIVFFYEDLLYSEDNLAATFL